MGRKIATKSLNILYSIIRQLFNTGLSNFSWKPLHFAHVEAYWQMKGALTRYGKFTWESATLGI